MPHSAQTERQIDSSTAAERLQLRTTRARMARVTPEQLLTVSDAAACVGCCEETIRRAYLARQLDVLRFGTNVYGFGHLHCSHGWTVAAR